MRFFLFIFLAAASLSAQDFQVWETQSLTVPICKNVQFQWETQTRWQNELIHIYTQENLVWRLNEKWEIGFDYRNAWTKQATGWHTRHHPIFDFTRFFSCKKVLFSFRNRFFINLDRKDFTWRGRALSSFLSAIPFTLSREMNFFCGI